MLIKNEGHSELMDSFYKYQNESYDDFREGMLHARPILATAMPVRCFIFMYLVITSLLTAEKKQRDGLG